MDSDRARSAVPQAPQGSAPDAAGPARAALDRALGHAVDVALGGPRGANPLVGAVLLGADGTVLATGHHRGAGTAHAEVACLAAARDAGVTAPQLRAATLVVTLEPCNHTGRTGPCSEAVRAAGIRRVHLGLPDTTARASGGAERLAADGVAVTWATDPGATDTGHAGHDPEVAARAARLNERWLRARAEERPFVTLKTAQTLDGFVAAPDGSSRWITSAAARGDAQRLRERVDAVLVGSGTVAADDPRLTARDAAGHDLERQPLRAVLGSRPVPAAARVRGSDGRFLHLATRDPRDAVAALHDRGVEHVMVEGGGTVAAAFLAAGLVDELWHYTAPVVLGDGIRAVAGFGAATLADAVRLVPDSAEGGPVRLLGPDVFTHLAPAPAPGALTTDQEV